MNINFYCTEESLKNNVLECFEKCCKSQKIDYYRKNDVLYADSDKFEIFADWVLNRICSIPYDMQILSDGIVLGEAYIILGFFPRCSAVGDKNEFMTITMRMPSFPSFASAS